MVDFFVGNKISYPFHTNALGCKISNEIYISCDTVLKSQWRRQGLVKRGKYCASLCSVLFFLNVSIILVF